jgi:phage-related protein
LTSEPNSVHNKGVILRVIIWFEKTRKSIQKYPKEIRMELGLLLHRLQKREFLTLPYSRSMKTLGSGCFELRVRGEDGAYRVFYYLKNKDLILVFHTFKKKTQKTPKREFIKGQKNLKELLNEKKI